jgi:hypothetical protein
MPKPPQESKLTSATQEHIQRTSHHLGCAASSTQYRLGLPLARPLLLFRPPAAFPSHPIPLFTFTQCHVLHLQSRKPYDPTSAPPSPLPSSRPSRANQSLAPSPHHTTTPSTLPPPNVKCRRRFANSMRSLLEFFWDQERETCAIRSVLGNGLCGERRLSLVFRALARGFPAIRHAGTTTS